VSVWVAGRQLHRLRAEPGQFFLWRFLDGPGWTRAHPWSLSAAPDSRGLRITVKDVGDGGTRLRSLRPGTRVLVEGPFGRLSPRSRSRRKVALIGAGVGIAPLRALAEGLPYAPGDATVLYRSSAELPLFRGEFDALVARRGLQLFWLPGHRRAPDSWLGDGVGAATDLAALRGWMPDVAERDVYVCGPGPWAEQVRATALAAGVPAENVHVESFGW
jgi:ferredoxin-NADP reductase